MTNSTSWWGFMEHVFENQAKLVNLLLYSFGLNTLDTSHQPQQGGGSFNQNFPTTKNVVQEFVNSNFSVDVLFKYGRQGWDQFKSDTKGFINGIYWKDEYWLQGLIVMHIVLFIIIIMSRRNMNIQAILFAMLCFMTYMAESLNRWCGANWNSFSTLNYFDSRGFFIAVTYAFPLLFLLLTIVINMLITSASMVIQVKRRQLKIQAEKNGPNKTNKTTHSSKKND